MNSKNNLFLTIYSNNLFPGSLYSYQISILFDIFNITNKTIPASKFFIY